MTDTDDSDRPRGESTDEPPRETATEGESDEMLPTEDVQSRLLWAALVVLGLLAAFALLQFYNYASLAIDRWAAQQYRAILQAAFNLIVLLTSGVGIAAIVRQLSE